MTRTLFVACAMVAIGCQFQQLSVGGDTPLEIEDVEELPGGEGSDEDVSGAYQFTRFAEQRCECRDGDAFTFGCEERWALQAKGLWLEQDGGALTVSAVFGSTISTDAVLSGGIDGNGTIEVGASQSIDEQGVTGQAYTLLQATVAAQNTIEGVWTTRLRVVDGDTSFDCDLAFEVELGWWSLESVATCSFNDDCHPERPFCFEGSCSAGAAGDTCSLAVHCASGFCVQGRCEAGSEGDPCATPLQCASEVCGDDGRCAAPDSCGDLKPCLDQSQRCYENQCQAGVEGDSCDNALHCAQDFVCVSGGCYDGSEGDPCQSANDCADVKDSCVMGACYDGSVGDPCETDLDCEIAEGLSCSPDNVCQ